MLPSLKKLIKKHRGSNTEKRSSDQDRNGRAPTPRPAASPSHQPDCEPEAPLGDDDNSRVPVTSSPKSQRPEDLLCRDWATIQAPELAPSPSPYLPHDFDLEPHGLFILHPTPEVHVDASEIQADIVAVHGLNGTSRKTWTEAKSGKCWLEDFLPDSIPTARIMTFGYDSGLAFSRTTAGIDSFARDLLNRLHMVRSSHEARNRPLVFIAHSLGGIVVKKALVLAYESGARYGSILTCTKGIVFMGTPHRGSDLVQWSLIVANMINVLSLGRAIKKELLRGLKTNSQMLTEISRQFIHRSAELKIMSFTELLPEPPLNALVVPELSAVLGLPNETVFPINASHRGLSRFPSKSNQNYLLLVAAVREIAFGGTNQVSSAGIPAPQGVGETTTAREFQVLRGTSCVDRTQSSQTAAFNPIVHSSTADVCSRSVDAMTISKKLESFSPSEDTKDLRPDRKKVSPSVANSRSNNETISVKISLPRVSTKDNSMLSEVLKVSADTLVCDLGVLFQQKHPNIKIRNPARFSAFGHNIRNIWVDVFTTAVEVTDGRPCYDKARGFKIHRSQSIMSFLSKAYPAPVEAKIDSSYVEEPSRPFAQVSSECICVGQRGNSDLRISLHRTVRIPEDGKKYNLPPDLGVFPLFDIRPFSHKLPPPIVSQGGLFLPIYQMEAMWIHFETRKAKRFVVRPFVGGVNAISGESVSGDMGSLLRQMSKLTPQQDYLILPEQLWLDGIATSPGIVRQFVATTMAPRQNNGDEATAGFSDRSQTRPLRIQSEGIARSDIPSTGNSIEWQVTGQDSVGGIQLQIIPEYDFSRFFAGSAKDVCASGANVATTYAYPVPGSGRKLDLTKSREELGIKAGEFIHSKDMSAKLPSRLKTVHDLIVEVERRDQTTPLDVIEMQLLTAQHLGHLFDIYVKSLTGATLTLQVDRGMTVYEAKLLIQAGWGIPLAMQRLVFASYQLENEYYLEECNIEEGSTLHLILPLRGGGAWYMHVTYQGRTIKIEGGDGRIITVYDLKHELMERLGIPAKSQVLSLSDKELPDDAQVHKLHGMDIQLTVVDDGQAAQYTLGAGGTIIQHIKPDTNEPGIWDVANSKIINLQLVNARTFKKVTGLPPPSTPITAETYAKTGLPFFKLWGDDAEEGVAGQWGPLKGVEEATRPKMKKETGLAASSPDELANQRWGLLPTGVWGRLDKSEEEDVDEEDVAAAKKGFDFPVVLLDPDGTLPPFKSVMQDLDTTLDELRAW